MTLCLKKRRVASQLTNMTNGGKTIHAQERNSVSFSLLVVQNSFPWDSIIGGIFSSFSWPPMITPSKSLPSLSLPSLFTTPNITKKRKSREKGKRREVLTVNRSNS